MIVLGGDEEDGDDEDTDKGMEASTVSVELSEPLSLTYFYLQGWAHHSYHQGWRHREHFHQWRPLSHHLDNQMRLLLERPVGLLILVLCGHQ